MQLLLLLTTFSYGFERKSKNEAKITRIFFDKKEKNWNKPTLYSKAPVLINKMSSKKKRASF